MKYYNIKELTQQDIPNYLQLGKELAPCVLFGVHDKPFAWICREELCDYDFIKNNNINHIKISGSGSTIVCSKGDIDLGFFGDQEFCNQMLERISKKFAEILTDSKFVNNDFMYNGNKYGAVTSIKLGDCYYLGVHISNEIDTELIGKICLKKCFKKPEKLPITIDKSTILSIFDDGGVI